MSRGDTEIPVSEDYATTEEPTMPILVEEGTITGPSKKVPPPVSAMASLTPGCNGVSTVFFHTTTDLAAHPVQNSIEKIVTEITTPKAETNPLGRNRRTKTTQNSSDLGTQVVQLRRVGKHSCNLCQSPDSTTPKRPRSDCNVSEVKRTRRKENPGPTEELFAPLKLGWIREIVTRHISSHAKQDVYYHPPYGKKLRSLVEIGKYLKQENMTALLTVDNFTFFAEPLGYGEPFEIVRGALMRSQSVSKANGSPKKEQILTPKKGYHIKKSKLTPKSTNNPKTKAKSAKQKSVEKMAKHAHVAESSDEEYQVITEIAESDEVVALHLAETDNLEIGHQAEAVVKNTKVQIKKKITHSSEQGNIFSSPERKEVYQETKNPKYIASTQSLMIAPGSVSERYITRTGSPKRIRITAENKNGNSSMNKKMAEHCQNVQKPVEFPQEDQLSPKESYSIKVNETHEGEHSNQHETEKISLSRHNNYISLNPVVINDIDEHYEVSETVHKKSKRKRIEKNMNGIKLTGKEKLGLQKKQIKKEKPLPSEVLFVASGILENFEEDHVKATELSGNTMSTILPTLHIKEEPVENEFLPVISSVKSGKEAEEMLETSEEPLRLWFNQTSNPQKARRGKAIGAQPRNTKNYPEINGQKTHKTTVVSRRQLKTNLGSTNIVKEQNFVPQNDKTTSTVPFLISSKKKKKNLSPQKIQTT
ncbi:bromodomain adjacent to zinc finger domain protein 2A-like isoform X3 [Penaeus chinensis]|uniref:bromodomain adjacent to zinc finger domain protein 2A-like isoform X3 n=1 Tax=Penaeus chinensis TaxID=139456 RepID=UPI001FB7B937|nr:bromodomain adjacent to zinc finger domain protein 2A-like isoform X3 [Penaeus chinensis]XP_047489578.1 bromodomain adjacent to zinc finger domain protein 2A-like isoform X3 [Penaeus chinensis]